MSDQPYVQKPSPELLKALDESIGKIVKHMAAKPESGHAAPPNDKFAGPVAETVIDPETGSPV